MPKKLFHRIILLPLLLSIFGGQASLVQAAPLAKMSASPTSGSTPLTVSFSSTGSTGSFLLWDFGYSFPAPNVSGTQYYVNNVNGNDANSGVSAASAFRTLSKASSVLQPGDKLNIINTGSPYRETLRPNVSGTVSAPIVIEGNHSIITGLNPINNLNWTAYTNEIYYADLPNYSAGKPKPVINGLRYGTRSNIDNLSEGKHAWSGTRLYVNFFSGTDINNMDANLVVRGTGVEVGGSYLHFRNLTAEYVSNDGFNLHGNYQGLEFVGIESRYNPGQGFSAHDNIQADIKQAIFHDNDIGGVVDVGKAQTNYESVISHDNHLAGMILSGASHTLSDITLWNNDQFDLGIYPQTAQNGNPNIFAQVSRIHSRGGSKDGTRFNSGSGGSIDVSNSIFTGATQNNLVIQGGSFSGDYNVIENQKISYNGSSVTLASLQSQTDSNAHSVTSVPVYPYMVSGQPVGAIEKISIDPNPMHVFRSSGNYVATLTAYDEQGNISQKSTNITVIGSGNPTPTPNPTSSPQPCQNTDINQDGIVDLSDYSALVAEFFSTNPSDPRADINQDGIVDLSDYSLLVSDFFETTNCGS